MRLRGILLGCVALGAAYFAERQLGTALQDVRRYDRLRAMSGDPPFAFEALKAIGEAMLRLPATAGGAPAMLAQKASTGGSSLLDTMLSDVRRYLAMRAM